MTRTTLDPVALAPPVDIRKAIALSEVLEVIDQLSEDDREDLYEQIRVRRVEAIRARMFEAAEEAKADYAAGNYRVMTPEQIVGEMFS